MKNFRFGIFFFSLYVFPGFAFLTQSYAQSEPLLIESSTYIGSPLHHSSSILYDTDKFSWGQDLDVKFQSIGKKKWQQMHGFPRFGLHFLFMNIGEPDTLGFGYSLMPNISFSTIQKEKWELRFQFSYGLSFLNKSFNEFENPLNNAISSNINAGAVIKLENQFRLNPQWWLKTGINLIHYSNGAATVPNLGINLGSLNIGLSYRQSDFTKLERIDHEPVKYKQNKWGGEIQAGVGFQEKKIYGGPAYPVYNLSSSLVYRLNLINHMRIGFEYEYNRGTYFFARHIWLIEDDEEARKASARWHLFYAHEFRFGPLGLYFALGFNFNNNSTLQTSRIFDKLTVRYYLPPVGKPATSIFLSINLKSNLVIAEYYSLSIGAAF